MGGLLFGDLDEIFLTPKPVEGLSPNIFLGILSGKGDPVFRMCAYVFLVDELSDEEIVSISSGREREWFFKGDEGGIVLRDEEGIKWGWGWGIEDILIFNWSTPFGFSGVATDSFIRLYPNPEGCMSSEADITVAAE